MPEPLIRFLDVHKAFDRPVLAGVDLEVLEGETVSILGPSGTGKSVLLKTSIGLIPPDRGDVIVDGESVLGGPQALQRIRAKAGYVFQYSALFDSMNVLENVSLGIRDEEQRLRTLKAKDEAAADMAREREKRLRKPLPRFLTFLGFYVR